MCTHTGKRPFTCEVCDREFAESSKLNAHVHTHMVKKPLSCGFCDKKFTESSSLIGHMRINTDERPFKLSCEVSDNRVQLTVNRLKR